MSLSLGELVGYIELKDKNFDKGLDAAGKDLSKLQSATTKATASIESTVTKSFAQIAQSIADGIDPNEAIRDLDRLEAALNHGLSSMEGDADRFASELDAIIGQAFGGLDDDAEESGRRAGTELTSGLRAGLSGMESEARTAGQSAAHALDSALSSVDSDLREDGRKAGQALSDGLKQGLGDADGIGRRAGDDVADGLGDGGGSKLHGIAGDWMGSLKGMGWAAAGAALGDLLMEGIHTAIDRETTFAILSAKIGAFGPESERLGRVAGELYANAYGDSLDDVTEAIARVYQNIPGAAKLSDDSLKSLAAHGMDVAQVMDEEIGPVSRAVGQMIKTGIAKNAEEAFDILTRGQQSGVNSAEDLLDTFSEYSTIFRDLGLNGKDALGLMSQGLKAGARDSDTVADALKELDIRVKDMSASKALKAIGLAPKEMAAAFAKGGPVARKALDQILDKLGKVEDPAKRSQLAVQLFGTKAEDMAKSINALNLDKAKTAVGGFKDAVANVDKTLGSTAASGAESWSRSWENTLGNVGSAALKSIQQLLPSPADFQKQWDEVGAWFTGTVGPFFSNLWTSVKDKTVEIWNGIGDWLSDKASSIGDWLGKLPGKVGEFFSSGWESVKTTTAEKWESIKAAAISKATAALDWLKALPGKIGSALASGFDSVRSTVSEKWESIKQGAITKATELLTWVKSLPGKIKTGLGNLGSLLLSAGQDLIAGLVNGIKAKAQDVVNAAKGVVQDAIDGAKHLLGIASPSKVAEQEIGRNVMLGAAKGIEVNEPLVIRAVEAMATRAAEAAKAAVEKVNASITKTMESKVNASIKKTMEPKVNASIKKTMEPKAGFVEPGAPVNGKGPVSNGVTVNVQNLAVREHADIDRIGSKVAFDVVKRG